MKKISIVAILAMISMPLMAKETAKTVDNDVQSVVEEDKGIIEQYEQQFTEPKIENQSNPKTKFPHGLQFGLGVSPTSGLNAFVGYNNKNFDSFWWKRFGIRFDFATYSPIKSKLNSEINDFVGKDGVKIGDELKVGDFALDAKHYGAMIDFYPFGDTWFLGGWRVSGGYMAGKLDLDAGITSRNKEVFEFELDGHTYTYDTGYAKGKAKVNWKYSGPYLGTGFDLGIFRGFKLYFDAGVVFTDKTAKANLDVPVDGLKIGGTPVKDNDTLKENLDKHIKAETKDIQKDLDDYPYYPLIKVGFMYRF